MLNRLALAAMLASGAAAQPLANMTQAIRAGEFKQVTSVLVSRHGEIVYETYFDQGGAEALRNTRSATKTITGMLVGIAIEKGNLPGVDAPVFDSSPTSTPWPTPIPARKRSPSRTSSP